MAIVKLDEAVIRKGNNNSGIVSLSQDDIKASQRKFDEYYTNLKNRKKNTERYSITLGNERIDGFTKGAIEHLQEGKAIKDYRPVDEDEKKAIAKYSMNIIKNNKSGALYAAGKRNNTVLTGPGGAWDGFGTVATQRAANGMLPTSPQELLEVDWNYVNENNYIKQLKKEKAEIEKEIEPLSAQKGKYQREVAAAKRSYLPSEVAKNQEKVDYYNGRIEPLAEKSRQLEEQIKNYNAMDEHTENLLRVSRNYGIDVEKFDYNELNKWAEQHGYVLLGTTAGADYRPTYKTSEQEREDYEVLSYLASMDLAEKLALKHPAVSSVGTVVTAPIRGVTSALGTLEDAVDTTTGKGINLYSKARHVSDGTNTIRNTVKGEYASKWFGGAENKVIGNVGEFVFDTAMSMGDNIANLLTAKALVGGLGLTGAQATKWTSNITSALLSSDATYNGITNAKKKGLSDTKALVLGISTGTVELLTEKYSLDNILGNPKGLTKTLLKGFVAEGSEEVAANVSGKLLDRIISGEESDIVAAINEYKKDGKSDKDALIYAIGDSLLDDLRAGLSGGFSGMGMSGAYHGINRVKTSRVGRNIVNGKYSDVSLENVIAKGLDYKSGTDIRQKAEAIAAMEKSDNKKNNYHYKIGELAMEILADDKTAFWKNRSTEQETENPASTVGASKETSKSADAPAISDIAKGKAIIHPDSVTALLDERSKILADKYNLDYQKVFNANREAMSSEESSALTDNVIMQYADALAQSINPNTNLWLELAEHTDDIGQFIFDSYKNGYNSTSANVDGLLKRFTDILGSVSENAVDMHRIIYGDLSNNAKQTNSTNYTLTDDSSVPKMREELSQNDVDGIISAMHDTLKQNALHGLSNYMKKNRNLSDIDKLARMMVNIYRDNGNIVDFGKFFKDDGMAVTEAIKRTGGNGYESKRAIEGRTLRDTSDVERAAGERTQEHSEGVSRETGDAQGTASERTTRKQIDDIIYNEVARESYTEDMSALESENRAKYGVDTIYYSGHAIDGVGTQLNGFYHKGTLYLQIDDAQPMNSIRDHEITHHFGKSKAYETFRKAVKAKMSVNKFNEWKAEVRLAYGDVLTSYLATEFEKSGRALTNEQLQTLMDDYLEEEMMANLNAETVNFAKEYAKEIADFRNGIDMTSNNSNAEVSTESKAENKVSEYAKQIDTGKADKLNDAPRRSMVGIKSLTADKEAYNKAVEMDKQGYDIEELWEETGWSKGVDGHFKTELDDSKYEFMMPSASKKNLYVKDFVKHDELFAAYPQIKDIPVLYDENMDDEGEAMYLPNIGEHIDGVGELGIIRINPQKSIYELKKSMLHELQHVIQFIEGFEQGASESYWRQRIKEGYDIGNINDYLQLNVSPAHQLYEDTAGEREARDVVDRMNFTPEQRKNTFPYSMDDSEGVVFADGSSVAAFTKGTKQIGVMWTVQQGILDKKEVAAFYSKVSELRNNKYRTFRQSADGNYIFSVDNKLIYSDADYEYPKIKTVITFETDDENLIDYARECFYEGETYRRRFEDTKKIAEIMLGEETVKRADYNPNATDERVSNHSRESESGTAADSRSGEDVRRSVSTDTQDRITEIAKDELFHEELTELARKNKQEFISRIRHNEQLQKRLDNAQRQMRLTKVPLADRAKVEKLIKSIVTDMHSVINPRDIHAEVLSIYDEYIAAVKKAGNAPESVQNATDNMVKRFTDVAADIIDNAQDIAVDEDFARLKGWLKNTDIKFPDDAKAEAHFAEFRKMHFGSISLTNDGLPIDMAYNELCEVFPYIFNKSVTAPADQLNAIADALQVLKPETYNPHAEYIEDAIEHVVSLFVLEADGISVTKDTRADRLVKKAESQKVTALEKQKEAFQRKYDKHKEKSDEQINKLKEQLKAHSYTQYWERRLSSEEKSAAIKTVRQRQKISMAKAHIRKMVSELKHGLDTTEKSGGIPKELVKAIAEVCSVIDFHTDRTTPGGDATKASLKLDALQVQYDNLKNNPDYDIQSEWHEEISEYIKQLNNTVRNKRVIDLNLMELSALEDILVQIRHTIANAKKQIGIDTAMENREIGMKICEDLNGKEDFIGSTKKMLVKRIGTNVFAANTLNPMRVAEMISGYNRDGEFYKVFRQLNDGVHKGDMFKMDATKPFNLLMEGPGNQALMYDFLTQLHDTDIKDTNGNTVMLTKNMICEVIMLWERKQGRVHLENGGMTIPNIKLFNDGKTQEAYTEGAVRTAAITEWDITRLRSMLDSYDKAWIDEARILFNEKSQKAINETSLQLVGRTIANAKNYIPIHTDTKFVRTDIEGLKVDATLEGAGSLKAAVENAKQPVLITGLSYSTSEHIDFVAKYHGLAIPIRNFNKVYNVTFADENNTTQSVKDTIGHKWGAKIQKGVIEQTLKDLQTTRNRESDVFNKVMGTIQSNWVGATLNSNPSVALKQLTSYVTASSVLGSTPLVKALPYFASTKATIEEIDRYTGIHFKRRLGYSTQELGDRANRKTGQGLANKARKAMSQSQITAWVNHLPKGFFPTNWMQSVDCRVAAVLWEASKYYVSDTLGIAKGSENYWKEVTQIYERTIEETQSNYDTLHKPEVLKSTSEMTRLISMFQNDALQGSGLLWTSFNDWNTKHQNYKIQSTSENKKALEVAQERFEKAAFAQVSSALTLATLTLVARALLRKVKPYKDEEKNKVNAGSISKQVGMDTLENLFTNAIPVLGNLLVSAKDTFVYGYDLASVPTFDTVQNLIDSISGVYDVIDKWDITAGEDRWNKVRGALNELAISAATAFGIPAQNAINMFNGIRGYVGDIKEGDFFHDINEIIATKRRVFSYADLASAVASGDRKKEQKILEYYKNIGVEVQKSSLTTQLKPAYVKCFVDEPEKAHAIRKSLVLRYDYSDDAFNDWIYEAYAKALISDEEYATELENAAKRAKIPFSYTDIRSSIESVYCDLLKKKPREASKMKKTLSPKYGSSDFDKWEKDVISN